MSTRISTSNPGLPGLPGQSDLESGLEQGISAASGLTPESVGLPDEADLARLATEFFNALPNEWEPGKTCPTLASKGIAALASIGAIPGAETGVTGIPSSLASVPVINGVTNHGANHSAYPHSVDPTPQVAGEWQTGAAPTLPIASPSPEPAPTGFHVPLPELRELGVLSPSLGQETRIGSALTPFPFYFLSGASPFASGIRVPGTYGHETFLSPHPLPGQGFDVEAIRRDFPILRETVNGRPLIWLDNAATTQKPQAVIDRLAHFYAHENSNIHRAAHELAARATDAYEASREITRRFINARSVNEVVFVRGTTEGINLVAQSWGRQHLKAGDEILITWLEHHANIVPWQQLAEQTGAVLKVAPVDDRGQVCLESYAKLLGPRTRLVAFTQVSNALGTITPAAEMTRLAQAHGAKVLVDGAQSVSHLRTDVQALGCDWFVFSGHKVFGPTGIGVVYGREELLNATDPWQGGGNMIRDVTFEKTLYQDAPTRFEAGTGNIADAVGLGAALEYVERIGIEAIAQHEHDLLTYGTRLLEEIPGLKLIGRAPEKAGVLSFVLEGYNTEEIGAALNQEGIAVRSGHHCAQPILRRFGLEATVRPSLALYNTHADVDALVAAVWKLRRARGLKL
jgi:cysteine desulfurase/selenocysteine lyase